SRRRPGHGGQGQGGQRVEEEPMSPFQEFRFWLRRSPASERVTAGLGAALAVAVLALLLVPGKHGSSNELVAAGSGGGSARQGGGSAVAAGSGSGVAGGGGAGGGGTTGAGGSAGAAGSSAGSGGGSGAGGGTQSSGTAGQTQASSGAGCPTGTATGVSGNQVKLAVGVTTIVGPAANSIFGIATPDEQRAGYQAAIDGINAEGGIGCKQIV